MKKVLWFSRHNMTADQLTDLNRIFGEVEVNQLSKTIETAFELKAEVESADIVAIVAPINLEQQFLKLAGSKPVITVTSERIVTKDENGGEDKVEFKFRNWLQIKKIEVITEVL